MSDSIDLVELQALCDEHERLLRAQTPDGKLEVEIEGELAGLPATTARLAIARLALLKHVYRLAWTQKEKPKTDDTERAHEAAQQLLRREPVRLQLSNGRQVQVTGRSYGALLEISAHNNRIRLLSVHLEEVSRNYEAAIRVATQRHGRQKARKAAKRWAALYTRIASEILRHRERLHAHSLTANGAPARPDELAPSWWQELTPEDDARLLMALYEVGVARYARLGEPPESKKERKAEDWGFSGLLAAWGERMKVAPSTLFDYDLGIVLTQLRVTAYHPEELAGV